MAGETRIPISALGDDFGVDNSLNRDLLNRADVIIAWDVDTQGRTVMYGRDTLMAIVEAGESRDVNVVIVELDADTEELDWLATAVRVVKGTEG